jgi:hypothetical protein
VEADPAEDDDLGLEAVDVVSFALPFSMASKNLNVNQLGDD